MATPAERQALIIIGAVALLGGGIRLWRAYPQLHPALAHHDMAGTSSESEEEGDAPPAEAVRRKHGHSAHPSKHRSHRNRRFGGGRGSDSTSVIDLDRATVEQIESLGVLRPGMARVIVADRDDFGPFGSMHEVERIPYLNRSDLRRLAPRVTFSLLPRPKNTVIPGPPDPVPRRRKRSP